MKGLLLVLLFLPGQLLAASSPARGLLSQLERELSGLKLNYETAAQELREAQRELESWQSKAESLEVDLSQLSLDLRAAQERLTELNVSSRSCMPSWITWMLAGTSAALLALVIFR
jgi:septal ring factor EnvC (AmiA/AmiB activator)